MRHIAIVWDFDGTLTPHDSTSKVIETLQGDGEDKSFWALVHSLRGDKKPLPQWEHILAMDAPIWMYSLSRFAFTKKIPLNKEFFEKFVLPKIKLFDGVVDFLMATKNLAADAKFKKLGLEIHHFIVSAGLKDLIELVFPEDLITWTFGCRYTIVADKDYPDQPESVPVFCMDETEKTRSIFEISKGAFCNEKVDVNTKVEDSKLWAPFENIIYVGDGETDIPALSLVRSKGGLGVAVYNPQKPKDQVQEKLKKLRFDCRTDLITPADFSIKGELFEFIKMRCIQIRQRYESSILA